MSETNPKLPISTVVALVQPHLKLFAHALIVYFLLMLATMNGVASRKNKLSMGITFMGSVSKPPYPRPDLFKVTTSLKPVILYALRQSQALSASKTFSKSQSPDNQHFCTHSVRVLPQALDQQLNGRLCKLCKQSCLLASKTFLNSQPLQNQCFCANSVRVAPKTLSVQVFAQTPSEPHLSGLSVRLLHMLFLSFSFYACNL